MQIIKIMGGLGNQMFEYAFAKAYSMLNQCNVLLDLSWFEEVKNISDNVVAKRVYELQNFYLTPCFATKEQCLPFVKLHKLYIPGCIRNYFGIPKYVNKTTKEKKGQYFEPKFLKYKKNIYFEGYFQTEKYFKIFRKELLKDFSLKTELNDKNKKMLEQIKSTNAISLHVRHGDYLNLQNHFKICSLDYYKNAINLIIQKVENPHFYIFSDDIDWVRKNFNLNHHITIVDINSSNEGYFDLELMKNCKHNITANSSFSWWGAWLNENPDKIIITPKTWFVNGDEERIDRIPEDWIELEN